MKILIDNGHGMDTPGKCSPDKRLMEWDYTRKIARKVVEELKAKGMDAELLVPEMLDVKLSERTKRVNTKCSLWGSKNVVCVSIHCNASGNDGHWHLPCGWSVFISENASQRSKDLCDLLFEEASKTGRKMRKPLPTQNYWVKSLAMTRDTKCPAVLTENFFQDNLDDVDWLLSEDGTNAVVKLHVDALMRYVEKYG